VTDGLLGLGKESVSMLSQQMLQGITKNVIGYWLGTNRGGFLFFGDDIEAHFTCNIAHVGKNRSFLKF
jgi:hypothetical protein